MAAETGGRSRLRRWRWTSRVLLLALVGAVGSAGSVAYAYWSAEGSGTATVASTTAQPIVVGAPAVVAADLYPGKTTGLGFTLSNPNPYPVQVTTLTQLSLSSSSEADCPAGTHLSVAPEVATGLAAGGYVLASPIAVPAGASRTPAELADLITMSTSAPDGCQGRTFTVKLSFTGSQS